jgi:hypothetical protein
MDGGELVSIDNVFDVWRYAGDLPVFRTLLGPTRIVKGDTAITLHDVRHEFRTQWHPIAGVDYSDAILDLACFEFAADDEGSAVQCPCGDAIGAADVLELLESIREHCDRRHPGALKVVWPK